MKENSGVLEILHRLESESCVKVECSDEISDQLLYAIHDIIPSTAKVFRDEYFYEGMSVRAYLNFFASLYHREPLVHDAVAHMHLQDFLQLKTEKLTTSQRKRVAIAREIISDRNVYVIQEPLKDMDEDSCRIMLKWMDEVASINKQFIITSMSLKQLYLIPGIILYIDKKEIYVVDNEQVNNKELTIENKLEKISAKFEDKILLFNPNDIDFIESVDGKCYLNVRQDAFVCNSTLDELEHKLRRFGFYRCHRSYLVNMQKVVEVVKWTRNSYSLKLEKREQIKIPLSKGRIEEMKNLYDF